MRCAYLVVALALAGCPEGEITPCEGEQQRVDNKGKLRITSLAIPVDTKAKGRLSGAPKTGARPMKALVLLDYSGSMYGGYGEAQVVGCSKCKSTLKKRNRQPYYYGTAAYREMVARWLDAAAPDGQVVRAQTLLFNKKLWRFSVGKTEQVTRATTLSFPWTLNEMSASQIATGLEEIPPDPFKGTGRNAGETHLKEALLLAADLLGDDGIIWIVTDNIADQSGAGVSAKDAARNLAFYNALNSDPRLQTVLAYPLHDKAQCTNMCGTSLFVYGIHVSSRERAGAGEVDRMTGGHLKGGDSLSGGLLWNPDLQREASAHAGEAKEAAIIGVPLRLKPMDLQVVSVKFEEGKDGRARPIRCRRTAQFGDKVPCVASVVVKNNLRHQILVNAEVVFENEVMVPHKKNETSRLPWAGAICAEQIETYNKKLKKQSVFSVRNLMPGAEEKIKVLLVLPAVSIAPKGLELVDTAFTDEVFLTGGMTARVANVRTRLYIADDQSAGVYGARNLPDIFRAHDQAEVRVHFDATVPVQNDGKLAALILIGGLLLLLLLIVLVVLRFQRVAITVIIDGVEVDQVTLPRISSRKVEKSGARVGKVKRGWSRKVSFAGARGCKTKKQGSTWIVEPPGGMEMRVELKRGARRSRSSGKKGAPGGF